jgi:hypothetical protein
VSEGKKSDSGKMRWRLLMQGCRLAITGALRVLEMGASKYGENNWQGVEAHRYIDALFRHMDAILERGLLARDDESGELHAHHVTTNALFLAHHAEQAAAVATRTSSVSDLLPSDGDRVQQPFSDARPYGEYPFPHGYVPRGKAGGVPVEDRG